MLYVLYTEDKSFWQQFEYTRRLTGVPSQAELDVIRAEVEQLPIRLVILDLRGLKDWEKAYQRLEPIFEELTTCPEVVTLKEDMDPIVALSMLGRSSTTHQFLRQLPETTPDEGFYFLIAFRRKWLIKQGMLEEEEAHRLFRSDEIKVADGLLRGARFNFLATLQKEWKSLENPNRYISIKGRLFRLSCLYNRYPTAFSLMVTYEPRSLKEGVAHFCFECLKGFVWDTYEATHPDKDLLSVIHKKRRRQGQRFALIDLDFKGERFSRARQLEFMHELALWFDLKGVQKDVVYACTTPSDGLHLVVRLNDQTGPFLFERRDELLAKVSELANRTGYPVELEVKTGQVLTHVPGFNTKVRDLTHYWKQL